MTWPHLYLFEGVLFLLSSLVTGPSFMSISSLVLWLWQLSFIRDWPEIRITRLEFSPISGHRGKLGIPDLVWISLIKFYWMLQNGRVTAFTVSELLRENRQRRWNYPSPPRLRLTHPNDSFLTMECFTYNKSSTYCSEIVQS